MPFKDFLTRRSFLLSTAATSSILGVGAAIGWLSSKFRGGMVRKFTTPVFADGSETGVSKLKYDISEYRKTPEDQLLFKEGKSITLNYDRVRRLTAGTGLVAVAVDQSVLIFDESGNEIRTISLNEPVHALDIDDKAQITIAFKNHLALYSSEGKKIFQSKPFLEGKPARRVYLTSVAKREDRYFLADAGNRRLMIFKQGKGVIKVFGSKDEDLGNPGFAVPSPYFDLELTDGGEVHVTNPGRVRVETYNNEGVFQSSWGKAGMKIEEFCGCCNPVYFKRAANGDFYTSEKGLARIKVFSSKGEFKGVVAGDDSLVVDKVEAKRACVDCRVGLGFDFDIDSRGRVWCLDPYRRAIRIFEPKGVTA